uniref:hypothetical protein n=1 Tax=Pseudotamlana agarivorans TaxID=481183 RepID=UPI000A86B4EB
MKEKLTFIFFTLYSFFSFSQVALNFPTDYANFLGVEQIYLEWIEDTDLSGGNVSYDLYFGTNSNPILYYSDLTPNTNGEIDTDTYIYQGAIMDGANSIPTSIFFKQITLNYETTYYWKVVAKNTK